MAKTTHNKYSKNYIDEVLNDFRIANESRQVSLLGRREVLTGKAKFGIFGDGKEIPQLALAKVFKAGDWRAGYYRDQTFMFASGIMTLEEFFAQLYGDTDDNFNPQTAGRLMNNHFGGKTSIQEGEEGTATYVNKFLYNSKEEQDMPGKWLDYGARFYDAALARWHVPEPKAEKYYHQTLYAYAGNNPIIFVDYDGNDYGISVDMENKTITINQTFYTDGTQKTTNLMQKSASYFNGQSGQYGLQTKNGTFKINYNVTVVEGGSFEENYSKAQASDEANYIETDYGSPDALTIFGDYGRAEEGGDYVVMSDNEEIVNEDVYKHEEMHTQGASHDAIGKQGTELNKNVVGATLEYAGKNSENLKIKVKNSNNSNQLKTKKPEDQPKVKYDGDQIKLKGSVVKL